MPTTLLYPIILASQSPRRRELLALTLLPFETMSVNTPETLNPTLSPEENVLAIGAIIGTLIFVDLNRRGWNNLQ
uniref:Septum formation protein Maf n=1 Tax=Chlorobium chlorochromatii (strain CaD3) TaxID=340177 RepID=Q3AQS7_CHLCH